ncbi:LysR family transcriptional regulator [Streptomyces sp. 796.1]|uniref:LysR family transcriptional regulator n=1 Tax=Streptomyces sp. 796.1 TaxID=3163029 RepID=UPI0039C8E5E4
MSTEGGTGDGADGADGGKGSGGRAEPSVHQLRLFGVLAEELHFGRAAARLTMSQPALSRQIRALERRLGLQLVERTSRCVELTPSGRTLLPEAHAVTAAMANLRRAAEAESRQGAGRMVVGVLAAESAMPTTRAILSELRSREPELTIDLLHLNFVNQYQALIRGEVDVAFLRPPAPVTLQTLQLTEEPRLACLPADDPLADKEDLTLADLSARTMVAMSQESPQEWRDFWAIDPRPDGTPVAFGPVATDVEAVLHVIANGQAIGFLPASASTFYQRPGIRYRAVADLPPCTMALTWPAEHRDRPATALIRSIAHEVLARDGDRPPGDPGT